jgi:hypothetical protein
VASVRIMKLDQLITLNPVHHTYDLKLIYKVQHILLHNLDISALTVENLDYL